MTTEECLLVASCPECRVVRIIGCLTGFRQRVDRLMACAFAADTKASIAAAGNL